MADIVGGDTISELMNAFSKFDTDHDGLIGTPELKNVLRFLGHNPTDAELQELAYAMDTNESGTIDLPEFLQAMAKNKADEDAEEDMPHLCATTCTCLPRNCALVLAEVPLELYDSSRNKYCKNTMVFLSPDQSSVCDRHLAEWCHEANAEPQLP